MKKLLVVFAMLFVLSGTAYAAKAQFVQVNGEWRVCGVDVRCFEGKPTNMNKWQINYQTYLKEVLIPKLEAIETRSELWKYSKGLKETLQEARVI